MLTQYITDRMNRQYKSNKHYGRAVNRALLKAGEIPIRATYDNGFNCLICGESGRCPGWHTQDDIKHFSRGE